MKNDEPLAICSIRDESRRGTMLLLYYVMTKEVVQCIHSIIRARGTDKETDESWDIFII